MRGLLQNIFYSEEGQTTTEYAITIAFIALAVVFFYKEAKNAIIDYFERIAFWVSLPIP